MHRYRKIQTTSTKCQYQAAASNPKWRVVEKWCMYIRHRFTARNVEPMRTCKPWNPVATKNVEPYTLSAIVKEASQYSLACRNVKYTPRVTVRLRLWRALFSFPSISLWWDHVMVTPEARSTAVLRRGTEKALIGVIPVGGQVQPNSGVGASLLWKKAQKKAKKKHTSDRINRIIPHRRPFNT